MRKFRVLICLSVTLYLALSLIACTCNVSMAHTEGTASDVIDETTTSNPNVSPNLNIPLKAM
jgi:hypothetical protein